MGKHLKEYFSQMSEETPRGNFHKVINLQDLMNLDWAAISSRFPALPKAWYELSHLKMSDRIEFSRDFFLSVLPYHPKLLEFITQFFSLLEDIRILITQKIDGDPFVPHLIYSYKNDGFFHGLPPASEDDIENLKRAFPNVTLPPAYLSFLKIHDGFSKWADFGTICSKQMPEYYQTLQNFLKAAQPLVKSNGEVIDPASLIPFYKSFDLPCFQCFYTEWHPQEEVGNVYYSGLSQIISHYDDHTSLESLAFPTFFDWLMFYLEKI